MDPITLVTFIAVLGIFALIGLSSVVRKKKTTEDYLLAGQDVKPWLVALATADLSSRTGAGSSEITVVRAEAVVWPDGSLGCPQPGMEYTQAQVDGSLIVLEAGGTKYSYHGGGGTPPTLCVKSG